MLGRAMGQLKSSVLQSTTDLFSHAADPLAETASYPGDPGLLGPESVSWPVISDVTAFLGGIRALLVQAAHPEVVAGVIDHSAFQHDPLGRLSRTSSWVTATTFGAEPEVARAVEIVRRAHRRVQGRSERGRPYNAASPDLAAWVHNALTDSFLTAYQHYGPRPLSVADADRFVAEQAVIGVLLDAAPVPRTAGALTEWIVDHPDLAPSAAQATAVAFLKDPPLPPAVLVGYRPLFWSAVASLPPRLAEQLDLEAPPGSVVLGKATIGFLRWALGTSPSRRRAEHRARSRAESEVATGS